MFMNRYEGLNLEEQVRLAKLHQGAKNAALSGPHRWC